MDLSTDRTVESEIPVGPTFGVELDTTPWALYRQYNINPLENIAME